MWNFLLQSLFAGDVMFHAVQVQAVLVHSVVTALQPFVMPCNGLLLEHFPVHSNVC